MKAGDVEIKIDITTKSKQIRWIEEVLNIKFSQSKQKWVAKKIKACSDKPGKGTNPNEAIIDWISKNNIPFNLY